ncbi:MAG: ferrous iron transport protein B [Anaerolineae bacterium]
MDMARPQITVALAGNPNTGKSTVFNALTGLQQHVANWPGKTVEKKEGTCTRVSGAQMTVVDLPGTYSLSAYSPEEVIARDYILQERPQVVINVVDAFNLERNLYLTVQLLELGANLVLAVNMVDMADAAGLQLDCARLSALLGGIAVVPMVARRGSGLDELLSSVQAAAQAPEDSRPAFRLDYGREIEAEIARVGAAYARSLPAPAAGVDDQASPLTRWVALKLLEGEGELPLALMQPAAALAAPAPVLPAVQASQQRLRQFYGDEVDIAITDQRYGFVRGLARQVIRQARPARLDLTDRIDGVVTHRWLGIPFFLGMMYLIFHVVQNVSTPYLDWVDGVINGPIARWLSALLSLLQAPAWLQSLLVDGVVAGVGSVLAFVPGLLVLYFFLSLLEDSGYMARAAFVMDRAMSWMGLHGKSFVPMILGFGCAVPAIYATRTLENRRDRVLTALVVPLMSCSARLPVYVVFGLAFFREQSGTLIWALYATGIVVAALAGLLLSNTVLRQQADSAFVLELPPYRLPTWHSLRVHMWANVSDFVRKAGSLILVASLVIWLLLNLPWGVQDQRHSLFGQISQAVAPLLAPAGFGHWDAAGALVTGLAAKEVVVSTLAQIYAPQAPAAPALSNANVGAELLGIVTGLGKATLQAGRTLLSLLPGLGRIAPAAPATDTALSSALRQHFTPLSGLSYLVFVLLYVPCAATLGAIKAEFGWRWAAFSAGYQTGTAYLAAVLVFQVGRLAGFA